MQIANQRVVTLNYTLTDDDGQVIDRSQGGEFAYLHGASNIIPGLEQALSEKEAGDKLTVRITPDEAYGERNDDLTQVVPRDMFQDPEQIETGRQFQAQSPNGDMLTITVTGVDGDNVTIDGNHPLAGKHLNFDVEVVGVREATSEELDHGHVHGAGGHQHD
jgi:FKBP-type peptidyl-prolyl cis-trans isomerase SlyD